MVRESRLVKIVKSGSVPSHVTRPYDFSDETGTFLDLAAEIKSLWPLPGILTTTAWIGRNWKDITHPGPESRFYPFLSPETLDRKPILEQAWPFIELTLWAGGGLALGALGYIAIQYLSTKPLKIRKQERSNEEIIQTLPEWIKKYKAEDSNFNTIYQGIETIKQTGRKRRLFSEIHNPTVKALKGKVKKDTLSQLEGAVLDYMTNSYGDAIERVDRMMGKRQTYSADRVENADFYRILAKLMGSIAGDSRIYSGKAARREQWFVEQMYFDAISDDRTRVERLTDSKHDVRIIRSDIIPTDEIIKRYRGNDPEKSQLGEIKFSKQIREICDEGKTAPRLLTAINLVESGKEEHVSIYTMLKGETLYDMINRLGGGHPEVLLAAEQVMDFMGLIYGKIPIDGLSRRNHQEYVMNGMRNAKVIGLLSGLDLGEMLVPVNESESHGIQVISKDPHAGNWGKLIDGRTVSYDNERTHTIALPGEISKFYLFSFDPKYNTKSGNYDDDSYADEVQMIINSFNKRSVSKATWDEKFYVDIKNFDILQGISLYSPYTLRLVMREKKRDILYKAKDAVEIIRGDFRESVYRKSVYSSNKKSYDQMFELVNRMITRNGF